MNERLSHDAELTQDGSVRENEIQAAKLRAYFDDQEMAAAVGEGLVEEEILESIPHAAAAKDALEAVTGRSLEDLEELNGAERSARLLMASTREALSLVGFDLAAEGAAVLGQAAATVSHAPLLKATASALREAKHMRLAAEAYAERAGAPQKLAA